MVNVCTYVADLNFLLVNFDHVVPIFISQMYDVIPYMSLDAFNANRKVYT